MTMQTILVVDDLSENLELLSRILQREGYKVLSAVNGEDALAQLTTSNHIDLIISDILMPIMDGYEFCRQVQQNDRFCSIPFIFYTATYTDEKDKEFGLKLGANRFLIKPQKTQDLLNIIKEELAKPFKVEKNNITPDAKSPLIESEQQYLRQYSSRLVHKLEDKLLELEQKNTDLEEEMAKQLQLKQHIELLNADLERRVASRTKDLLSANQKLLEMDQIKSMFIASMSHELRTPLNSIIGFTGIMLQGMSGEITDEQAKQLGIVKKSASHLLTLINDVIDVSKIESGVVSITNHNFDLIELIKDVIQILSKACLDKQLTIRSNLPESFSCFSDKRRIKQILINLLDNAIKFSNEGEIIISLTQRESFFTVTFSDTGIGISDDDANKLFLPFSKLNPTQANNPRGKGTGLGLYLSQRLANKLGGQITMTSEPNKGSNFSLTLPIGGASK
ncbi:MULTISPECIES: ATP-binding protein [Cycloclasticus]|jgi:two-component system, sensor histidine kinase and response regulator|uniref:histidine kinase n=1 Tax=Cycloclasticus zancles 78-ME TaxID=1198232 RepID=S5T9Q3_9GAMM|nr:MULTISPECIES: ATP-binding protein [Cycloclasticus]AFT66523.1 ATPase, histidine kinase-, DNA gyrase B-, and HSP90-like domain protein [Cycloclasticus sp. P1]AGS40456.1 Two-component system sensor histidine kinase/response regulator [Cycloclasticus zancles 78-ME]